MPICPKCHKLCKTAQGLGGHMRFRHQITIPMQSLQPYAQERIEKEEAENARLREQLNRGQKQRQDMETFYDKRVAEQNAQLKEMQLKAAGHQVESIKQHDEQNRLQQSLAEERAALQKQAQELQKQIEGLEMQRAQLKELTEKQIKELTERQSQKSSELEKRINRVEQEGQKTSGVEELKSEIERLRSEIIQNPNRSRSPSLLPPKPDLFHPTDSIRNLAEWLRRLDHR